MKKILFTLTVLSLFIANIAYAQFSILRGSQGGTGIGSATVGQIGTCLKVLSVSPLTYELGVCTGGGGSGSSTFSTTTPYGSVILQYPYTTMVTSLGSSSTTTSAVYFDPINQKYQIGNLNTASTTILGNLFLPTLSQGLLYNGSLGATGSTATTSASCSGSVSCSSFTVIGSSPITITGSGGSGGGLGTTTPWTPGQVSYVVNDSTLTSVATGTLSVPTGLTVTGNRYVIGGNANIGLDTGYVIPLQSTLDAKALGATTITVNGTANQITSSAGAQDLSANRTWTLSFPNLVIFPANASSTLFSTSYASSTIGNIGTLTFGGVTGSTWPTFCSSITGSSGLCDGVDDTSSGGNSLASTTPWTFGDLTVVATNGSIKSLSTSTLVNNIFPFTSYGFSTSSIFGLQGGFLSTASSTIVGNATTTGGQYVGGFYGAGLTACNSTTEKLLWSANGTFTCGTDQNTGGGGGTNYLTNSGSNTYLNTGTYLQAPALEATSTTATSTFSGGLYATTAFIHRTNNDSQPIFAVASSTATTTKLAVTSKGNVAIGTTTQSGGEVLDEVFAKSMMIEDMYLPCDTNSAITIAADGLMSCGWYYAEDTAAGSQISMASPTGGGISYGRVIDPNPSSGAGIFVPGDQTGWIAVATNTPVLETNFRISDPTLASSTTYYIGFGNQNYAGATFEATPTNFIGFIASSTQANWQAVTINSAVILQTDTGIASTTNITGVGQFRKFRVEAGFDYAKFYIQSAGGAMSLIATHTGTSIPDDINDVMIAGVWFGRVVGGGNAGFDVYRSRFKAQLPLPTFIN